MLTFIICSDVSGLQIKDRLKEQRDKRKRKQVVVLKEFEEEKEQEEKDEDFIEVEKIMTEGVDLFCIAGRKLSIFQADKDREIFLPTIHRVMLPGDTERFSLLYFMDCQK